MALGIVKPDGSENQLANYYLIAKSASVVSDNLVSAGAAANSKGGVSCTQYDEDGNVKFMANITNKSTIVKAIQNFPGGVMLVILAGPKHCDEQSACNNESRHRIMKVAADGKIVGSADIKEEFDKVNIWDPTDVYVSEDFQFCAVFIAQNPTTIKGRPTDYEILYHCIKENELLL